MGYKTLQYKINSLKYKHLTLRVFLPKSCHINTFCNLKTTKYTQYLEKKKF